MMKINLTTVNSLAFLRSDRYCSLPNGEDSLKARPAFVANLYLISRLLAQSRYRMDDRIAP